MKDRYINPFTIAEIARFTPMEATTYEESLKNYRDLKSSTDTAREEGWLEGKLEGKIEGKSEGEAAKAEAIAIIMIGNNEDDEKIRLYTGLSIETIREIRRRCVEINNSI
jgi:predicted transposase YdaD